MAEEKSSGKLIFYGILLVLLFFGLIRIFINGSGKFIRLELVGFVFLLVLSLIGFVGYAHVWGERVLFFVFLFYLVNLVLIWYFLGSLYLVLLFMALLGFVLSVPKKFSCCVVEKSVEEPHSEIFDVPKVEIVKEEKEPVKKVEKKAVKKKTSAKKPAKKTKYSPGKYVASKRSNIYHAPKCEWAKKIHRSRRVWFKSKEEAWEKGYKKHSCVE